MQGYLWYVASGFVLLVDVWERPFEGGWGISFVKLREGWAQIDYRCLSLVNIPWQWSMIIGNWMGFPWYRERGGGSLLEISTKFPPPLETSTKLPPPPQNFHQTSTPLKTHKTLCFTIENACAVVHTMETSTPPVETSTKLPGGWKFGGSFHGGWKFDGNFHQISTPHLERLW